MPASLLFLQLLIVPCQRNNDGVILFHQEALPLIPEQHRWALQRYEPTGSAGSVWQPGDCTVQEISRRPR